MTVVHRRTSMAQALHEDGTLLAVFVLIPRIEVVEIVAHAGFDGIVLDREHGPLGEDVLPSLVAAGQARGLHVMVRVRVNSPSEIGLALDSGADAVLVPHVQGTADAAATVTAARFPPVGDRSLNPYVRAASYGAEENYLAQADGDIAVMGMVEGPEGVADCERILQTTGLDGVFLGPMDLSAAMGFPGQPEHPDVVEVMRGVVEQARDHDKATGVFAATPGAARPWQELGVDLVVVGVDTVHLLNGCRQIREQLSRYPDNERRAAT